MNQFTNNSKRNLRVAIVVILLLASAIMAVYAVNLLWSSVHRTTNLTKEHYVTVEITGGSATGYIKPGDSISLSPALTNTGSTNSYAFLKITMPAVSGVAAYTFESAEGWSLMDHTISNDQDIQIWSYTTGDELTSLEVGERTSALTSSFTMLPSITGKEFKAMSSVDIKIDGYLVNSSAGADPENVWDLLPENKE